jgi:hypothetical protein
MPGQDFAQEDEAYLSLADDPDADAARAGGDPPIDVARRQ